VDDSADSAWNHSKLVTPVASVLCTLSSEDAIVKIKLLFFCPSLYGSEL